jgi:hypothetical protein
MINHNQLGFLGQDKPFKVTYTQWQGQWGCNIVGTGYRIQVGLMQHGNGLVYNLVPFFNPPYENLPQANHLNILEKRDCDSWRWYGSYVSVDSCLSALKSLINYQIAQEK